MQTRVSRFIMAPVLFVALAGLVVGCASTKEDGNKEARVPLADLSAPARATVERVIAGGQVDQISREVERGRTVYDVEATVDGRHLEFLIADSDGEVLGTEVPIGFSELPSPVQAAAKAYFGTSDGLTIMKGVEFGATQYEVEGQKNGQTVEVSFDPSGKRGD